MTVSAHVGARRSSDVVPSAFKAYLGLIPTHVRIPKEELMDLGASPRTQVGQHLSNQSRHIVTPGYAPAPLVGPVVLLSPNEVYVADTGQAMNRSDHVLVGHRNAEAPGGLIEYEAAFALVESGKPFDASHVAYVVTREVEIESGSTRDTTRPDASRYASVL